jgi:hypothetical protein
MFAQGSDAGYTTPIEGIRPKTLAYGQRMLMTELRMNAGPPFPFAAAPAADCDLDP